MHHSFTPRHRRPPLRIATVLLLIFLFLLLMSKFFKTDIEKQAAAITRHIASSLSTALFTSESSTLAYMTSEKEDSLLKQAEKHCLCSPVFLYVQASTNAYDSSLTKNMILIHTKKEKPVIASPRTASLPLEASRENELDTNESLDSYDNIYFEDEYDSSSCIAPAELSGSEKQLLALNKRKIDSLTKNVDLNYLLEQFYKINPSCVIDEGVWDVKKLLKKDLTINKDSGKPQILILHTHAHETFADSRPGIKSDSITGVGDELSRILKDKYGYNVLHSTKQYNYNTSYNEALVDLTKFLKEYPSIQIVIDLHRDGVSDSCNTHSVVTVGGETMAPIMFFNGVSNNKKSSLNYHTNKNLQSNLAFSLQMKLYAMQTYPAFTKKNFLKSFRYNMHVVPRYSLIEVGDNNNTVAEVKAAMTPLADTINHVLSSKPNF